MIRVEEACSIQYPYIIHGISKKPLHFTERAFIELWNKMGCKLNVNHKLTSKDIYETLDPLYS